MYKHPSSCFHHLSFFKIATSLEVSAAIAGKKLQDIEEAWRYLRYWK
jgi:hypothetical protein